MRAGGVEIGASRTTRCRLAQPIAGLIVGVGFQRGAVVGDTGESIQRIIAVSLRSWVGTRGVAERDNVASQIQQAIQFNDLDKYRSTAEDLEENLKKIQADITDVSTPSNLSDADMSPFEDAMNAANDIVAQYLEVAADIGVNAHTGMDSSEEMAKDAKEVAGAQAKFTSTVQQGYKHLGVKRSDIDMATLTLKAGKAL